MVWKIDGLRLLTGNYVLTAKRRSYPVCGNWELNPYFRVMQEWFPVISVLSLLHLEQLMNFQSGDTLVIQDTIVELNKLPLLSLQRWDYWNSGKRCWSACSQRIQFCFTLQSTGTDFPLHRKSHLPENWQPTKEKRHPHDLSRQADIRPSTNKKENLMKSIQCYQSKSTDRLSLFQMLFYYFNPAFHISLYRRFISDIRSYSQQKFFTLLCHFPRGGLIKKNRIFCS